MLFEYHSPPLSVSVEGSTAPEVTTDEYAERRKPPRKNDIRICSCFERRRKEGS